MREKGTTIAVKENNNTTANNILPDTNKTEKSVGRGIKVVNNTEVVEATVALPTVVALALVIVVVEAVVVVVEVEVEVVVVVVMLKLVEPNEKIAIVIRIKLLNYFSF